MTPRHLPIKLRRSISYGRNEIIFPVDSTPVQTTGSEPSSASSLKPISENEKPAQNEEGAHTESSSTNGPKQEEQNEASKKLALNPNHEIGYKEVVSILKDTYHFDENMNSTALDILALYLRGQKIIYMESKTYCESRLNSLMIPTILISAACSILNYILKDFNYGTILISSLNAFNSFILTIINYLKLAEKSQNHLIAAQRFHNLEARLELQSGRSLFFSNSDEIQYALEEMEKEIKEIQSSDQFLIPEAVRYCYPKIFGSNIFSLVKEIKNKEIIYINNLKRAVQKIHEHTKRRDFFMTRKWETTEIIVDSKEDLRGKEVDLEVANAEISDDSNFKEIEQKMDEYVLVLHTNLLNNNPIYNKNSSSDKISEQINTINPPILELPESNLESDQLYARITTWKEQYDEFLSKRKEMHDIFSNDYQKIKEKYEKDRKTKDILSTILKLKIEIGYLRKSIEDEEARKEKIKKDIEEEQYSINKWDKEKDEAFEAIVRHRQRYIDLSDEINNEITENIDAKHKWYRCNPCDFFNT